jgi:TPP-dependent pyruvate/acetoin dehydrogenase alpha subunit
MELHWPTNQENGKVTAVFGGTSEGDFHEALNIASVWEPLFVIENNGYGLQHQQMSIPMRKFS